MRISDWSSDVCSSDLNTSLSQTPFALSLSKGRSFFSTSKRRAVLRQAQHERGQEAFLFSRKPGNGPQRVRVDARSGRASSRDITRYTCSSAARAGCKSEEHTSELQSLMRISYAVFCLKKKQ